MGASTEYEKLAAAIHNPGRIVLGPTSTTGAFPYGGVNLGPHRDAEAEWHADYIYVRDPASGRIAEVGRRGAEYPELYLLIDGVSWDEDVLDGAFSRAIGARSLSYPSPAEARIEGTSIPDTLPAGPPILFAADDPAHKSVYFRRPYLTLSLRAAVAISRVKHAGLPMRFIPSPDTTFQDWQIARLENLVL